MHFNKFENWKIWWTTRSQISFSHNAVAPSIYSYIFYSNRLHNLLLEIGDTSMISAVLFAWFFMLTAIHVQPVDVWQAGTPPITLNPVSRMKAFIYLCVRTSSNIYWWCSGFLFCTSVTSTKFNAVSVESVVSFEWIRIRISGDMLLIYSIGLVVEALG